MKGTPTMATRVREMTARAAKSWGIEAALVALLMVGAIAVRGAQTSSSWLLSSLLFLGVFAIGFHFIRIWTTHYASVRRTNLFCFSLFFCILLGLVCGQGNATVTIVVLCVFALGALLLWWNVFFKKAWAGRFVLTIYPAMCKAALVLVVLRLVWTQGLAINLWQWDSFVCEFQEHQSLYFLAWFSCSFFSPYAIQKSDYDFSEAPAEDLIVQ